MRNRFPRCLFALLCLALFAGDAFAGPLSRLRARRSGGCNGSSCTTGGATFAAPVSGCAGGVCPLLKK